MANDYYQKNKDRWKIYYEKRKAWLVNHKDEWNAYKRKWRHGKGKEKERVSKKKSDAKYYKKVKNTVQFKKRSKEYGDKYYQEHKEQHSLTMKLRRAIPEVKKRNAKYNKKWGKENPKIKLANSRRQMRKFGSFFNMPWYTVTRHLKGWAKIIHTDGNQVCQICGESSDIAHHIFHKANYPELAFNRNNGIALCNQCHYEVHGKMLIMRGI